MALVIGDQISTEGGIVYVKNSIPGIGLTALTNYSEVTHGETGTNYYVKNFRYSLNGGITWSDWSTLTTQNIQNISINQYNELSVEYSYQPTGPNTSGLSFTSNQITATQISLADGTHYKNSVFEKFFHSYDGDVVKWYVNVTEKIFNEDILARYISRYDDNGSPDDFILYWKGIAKFLAFYVILARKVSTFYTQLDFVKEYLEGKGLVTSPLNTLDEVTYLMNTYLYQIRNRGTYHIYDKVVPDREYQTPAQVDGELLRTISYQEGDEFLFNLYRPEHFGWNLRNSSPLYRGMSLNENVNKIYEPNGVISSLTRWPHSGSITVQNISGVDNFVITNSGGLDGTTNPLYIKINPTLSYELDFFIKKPNGSNLTIGLDGLDANGSTVTHISAVDGTSTSNFITNANLSTSSYYVHIKCIIYGSSRVFFNSNEKLNINSGNNLIFDPTCVKIIPRINFNGTGVAYIKNITFLPLSTPYSRGFVQTQNFISCWLQDNRKQFAFTSDEPFSSYDFQTKQLLQLKPLQDLEKFFKKYLIPYNAHIKVTNIGQGAAPTTNPVRIFTEQFTNPFA